LDIYLPVHNLALECGILNSETEKKRMFCKQNGISFVEIPVWWDNQKQSVLANIHQQRPDLISYSDLLLPSKPSKGLHSSKNSLLEIEVILLHIKGN
jgi:hypothetical protein